MDVKRWSGSRERASSLADYERSSDEAEAFGRAEVKNPEGLFYLMRVGHRAAHRIGGRFLPAGEARRR